ENSPDCGALPWESARCCVNCPVAEETLAMKSRNWAGASADQASTGLAARHSATMKCLVFIGAVPRWNQDFTIAIGLHGRDQTGLFHLLQQTSRTVIAYAQIALHGRNGRPPVLQDNFHSLVI